MTSYWNQRLDHTKRDRRRYRLENANVDVMQVCSIEYLTTEIELVLFTFKSRTVHKIIEYLTLGLLSSL